jgi:hypothetical protein
MNKISIFIFLLSFSTVFGQVGINTTNPRQALHIAGDTGTMRVESLDWINNIHNGGDVNGDLDLTNDTFPLYVDENGDFTLELQTIAASDDTDAFDDTTLPTSSVFLSATDVDGDVTTVIKTFTITINRPAILEVKYGISFNVYASIFKTPVIDKLARRIENYITVTGDSRRYGPSSKSYVSRGTLTQTGDMYNGYSTYIKLSAAGTYDINFMGLVSTNLSSDFATTTSLATYVEFATGNDFLFMRLH